jgi:hypothetical protein
MMAYMGKKWSKTVSNCNRETGAEQKKNTTFVATAGARRARPLLTSSTRLEDLPASKSGDPHLAAPDETRCHPQPRDPACT